MVGIDGNSLLRKSFVKQDILSYFQGDILSGKHGEMTPPWLDGLFG